MSWKSFYDFFNFTCINLANLCCLFRFLSYCYLLSFNAWLLLAPIVLCYDWQVNGINRNTLQKLHSSKRLMIA